MTYTIEMNVYEPTEPDRSERRRRALGLRPGGPVRAEVVWRRGKSWAYLYDVNEAKPKREMSEAQRAALQKAQQQRRTCSGCGTVFGFVLPWRFDCPECERRAFMNDRKDACARARRLLARPDAVILDTETTDLDGYLVQVAVLGMDGTVHLDTLVNPQSEISAGAYRVHGISQEQVKDAPTFADLVSRLATLLWGKRVVVYNASFDRGILRNELWRLYAGADGWTEAAGGQVEAWIKQIHWRCAMNLYSAYIGEWSYRHHDYRYQPLPGGDHSALGDCLATLAVLRRMASDATEGEPNADHNRDRDDAGDGRLL